VSVGAEGYRSIDVCRIVGITFRQMDYWVRSGLIFPSPGQAEGPAYRRRYSLADLVQFKVLKHLIGSGLETSRVRRIFSQLSYQDISWNWEVGEVTLAGVTFDLAREVEHEVEKFRTFLEGLNPDDFSPYGSSQ